MGGEGGAGGAAWGAGCGPCGQVESGAGVKPGPQRQHEGEEGQHVVGVG